MNEVFKRLFLVFAVIPFFLYGCVTTQPNQQNTKKESLLQDFPLPNGEWTSYKKKGGNDIVWEEKGSGDIAMTSVIYGEIVEPSHFREMIDKKGRNLCDKYSSRVISEQPSNGYPSIVWTTVCQQNEFYNKRLYKRITGNDSGYLLMRLWLIEPEKEDWDVWLDYFNEVIVCDPRREQHPCPAGY
jgi:hypothetical protein